MNPKGGAGGWFIFLLLFMALTFTVLFIQGNPFEIPLAFGFALPTLYVGVVFVLISVLMRLEVFTLAVGLTTIAHYYWVLSWSA